MTQADLGTHQTLLQYEGLTQVIKNSKAKISEDGVKGLGLILAGSIIYKPKPDF